MSASQAQVKHKASQVGESQAHVKHTSSKIRRAFGPGRDRSVLFFVLVSYPPLSPRGPSAPVPGPPGPPLDPVEGPRRHGFCTRSLLISTFFNLVQIIRNNENKCFSLFASVPSNIAILEVPHFPQKHFFNGCSDLGPPGAPLDAALAPEHASRTASGPSKNRSKQKLELLKKHWGFPSKVEPWRTLGDPGAPPNRPHGPAHASRGPPASELGRQTHVLGPSLGPPENPTGPHLTKHMFC
jgi:hypothetical protein